MQHSFNKIKEAVANNTLLAYFDRQRPTYLIDDASPHSLGAVLAQKYDNHLRPVAFAHKALTETESRFRIWKRRHSRSFGRANTSTCILLVRNSPY